MNKDPNYDRKYKFLPCNVYKIRKLCKSEIVFSSTNNLELLRLGAAVKKPTNIF